MNQPGKILEVVGGTSFATPGMPSTATAPGLLTLKNGVVRLDDGSRVSAGSFSSASWPI